MILNTRILTVLFCGLFLLFSASMQAQETENGMTESGNIDKPQVNDNFYDRYLHEEKIPIRYDYIHEKDVFWEKRVWRVIDVREKKNHHFKYEKEGEMFITLLLNLARKGDLQLYDVIDDEFKNPMSEEDMKNIGSTIDTIITFDPETFDEIVKVVPNELDPNDIKQYRLKEVYFFDEETSTLGVRILGIAPIQDRYDDNGNFLNSGPMFWAYYPEMRSQLAKMESFNPHNDAARMTWEDVFEARLFSSYIFKESNLYDRRIKDYKTNPLDALLEADKIKDEIFNFEHDLWTY